MKIANKPARNRFEVDFLPPFGQPEVVSFGPAAGKATLLVALAAVLVLLTADE